MSGRYRGSNNSEDVGGDLSCSLVSAILCVSPARTAPVDDDRPVKDRNASSDLEQHNKTVEDQKAVRTWVVLLVELAPKDDDRPVKDKSADLDLVQYNRTVGD
ncbi:hypothetical protein QAD02_021208 [Eretmocerus hayati]|uniref:Uncharacterized protein n=1 Tax=Eretmocerus hayati TaxID=131215 RepID=A0ACC2PPT7_9HYME|nr:hypothetical protein QAD02_021208 [Eretmocerus hayati]